MNAEERNKLLDKMLDDIDKLEKEFDTPALDEYFIKAFNRIASLKRKLDLYEYHKAFNGPE